MAGSANSMWRSGRVHDDDDDAGLNLGRALFFFVSKTSIGRHKRVARSIDR